MQRLFFFVLGIFSCFLCTVSTAQELPIEVIPSQPSPEAYDLLKDSKGYIWIAHDQGVSRYDGAVFTNFSHPRQSSIAMTDLIEDKKGRIWCHNFSGQIYYIENHQLHLLTDYKYKEEQSFPRMVICGNELVATSTKGLFIYNLSTGNSTYHLVPGGTNSLSLVGNKVVAHGSKGWYKYEAGKEVVKITIDKAISKAKVNIMQLQCYANKDTFYMTANPAGTYYKLTLENDLIRIHKKINTGAFINTISVNDEKVWINTKENSFTEDGKTIIYNLSLTGVITDNVGNRWLSSLKQGLCVQYNSFSPRQLIHSLLPAGPDIRVMHTDNNSMFWGTTNGKLYQFRLPFSWQQVASFPKEMGAIERIYSFKKEQLLVAVSFSIFSYNYATKAIYQLPVHTTVKDAVFEGDTLYLALTSGIVSITKNLRTGQYDVLKEMQIAGKKNRCRSLAVTNDSLVAAYSDGVYIIKNNQLHPILYQGKEIYASRIKAINGRVVIATFTQGLFVLENGKLENLTEEDGLASNFIKDIKTYNGYVWLLYIDRIQQLSNDLSDVAAYPVPLSTGGISDFAILERQLFMTASNNVYQLEMNQQTHDNISTTFIDKIVANNNLVAGNTLKPSQNYLQFQVSTPFFSSYSKIIYQYRIKNAPDGTWRRGAPGQNIFDLILLEPGYYSFEIVATDINRKIISRPASYHFELLPAWYQHWLFKMLVALAAAAFVSYIVWLYYRKSLRQQQVAYERQLAIQAERHRISAEIHDDIGAGLSAIRLLTEITQNKLPESEIKQEVGKIHASVSELSYKMREVIWSLNTDNDHLENLLNYIRRQARLLFENSPIQLKVIFPPGDIPAIDIKGQKRRHIYLSVKEALHNCLKHSGAQNCTLTLRIEDHYLYISVTDDGRGFTPVETGETGNGLPGMKRRMQQINGLFEVEAQESTSVQFSIPLNKNV